MDDPATMTGAEPVIVPVMTFPAMYYEADATSAWGQKFHFRNVRLELAFIIGGALLGTVSFGTAGLVDVAGLLAAAMFLGALTVRQLSLAHKPEVRWYRGRAAAESVKTLAWRYSVGGEPFGITLEPNEAALLFIARLREVMHDLDDVLLTMAPQEGSKQITDEMQALRAQSLELRRRHYAVERIEDQRRWYASRARDNTQRLRVWMGATLALELAGVAAGILKALRMWGADGDLLGIVAAMVAAGAAWLQAKQHGTLASSYTIAAQELAAIASLIEQQSTEEQWEKFVASSEGAISREHTLWRASKAL